MSVAAPKHEWVGGVRSRSDSNFAFAVAGVVLLLWCLLYRDTLWSMVSTWARSDTFMHGFLIVPLSGYLIYERRARLRGVAIEPYAPGCVVLLILCVMWFAGWSARADVVQQFAVVGMITALLLIVLGYRFVRQIAGPLAYLFFAVPFGEIFISPLREFTTVTITAGLDLTGISVVRTGFYLSTSAGDFAVERACSGVRYLIASFALGTLFALLYLTSVRRRVIFILLSLIVPVLANGLRAYLIVVLAHLSSLRIATGVDHIIYGWIFFGIVMLLLFWFGARMEDRHSTRTAVQPQSTSVADGDSVRRMNVIVAAAVAAIVLLVGPTTAGVIEAREIGQATSLARMPNFGLDWEESKLEDLSWLPAFPGHNSLITVSLRPIRSSGSRVDVAIASYDEKGGETGEGGGLISFGNRAINSKVWREHSRIERSIETASGQRVAFSTIEVESMTSGHRRVIWYTYLIGSAPVAGDYWGKAVQAWTRIVSPGRGLWSLAFSTESADPAVDLNAPLEIFLREHFADFAARPMASNAPE